MSKVCRPKVVYVHEPVTPRLLRSKSQTVWITPWIRNLTSKWETTSQPTNECRCLRHRDSVGDRRTQVPQVNMTLRWGLPLPCRDRTEVPPSLWDFQVRVPRPILILNLWTRWFRVTVEPRNPYSVVHLGSEIWGPTTQNRYYVWDTPVHVVVVVVFVVLRVLLTRTDNKPGNLLTSSCHYWVEGPLSPENHTVWDPPIRSRSLLTMISTNRTCHPTKSSRWRENIESCKW